MIFYSSQTVTFSYKFLCWCNQNFITTGILYTQWIRVGLPTPNLEGNRHDDDGQQLENEHGFHFVCTNNLFSILTGCVILMATIAILTVFFVFDQASKVLGTASETYEFWILFLQLLGSVCALVDRKSVV